MANIGAFSPLTGRQHSDIDSLPVAVIGIDRSFSLNTVNRCAEKLLGNRRHFLGKPVETVGCVFPFLPGLMRQSLEKGRRTRHVEESESRCWLVTVYPYPKPGKEIAGVLAVLHDIGFYHSWFKRRLHHEKIEILSRITEQTAHEIRNPLTAIKGFLQLYRSSPESIPWNLLQEEISTIELSLAQLLNLSARCCEPAEKFDLNQLVCETLDALEERSARQKVWPVLSLSLDARNLTGERNKIKTLILHLCQNALDAMPDGGILSVTTEKRGRTVILWVADTGQGISPRDMERIFDPFFSTRPDKAGLGLTICRQILQSCKGSISVNSREGVGTEVTVTLPFTTRELPG